MSFADGKFRLVPAIRVDHYKLEPDVDNIFAEDNPGIAVSDISEISISPKLGAVWHFTDDWSLFGGYSRGFRSPPYNDVNIGFTTSSSAIPPSPTRTSSRRPATAWKLGYASPAMPSTQACRLTTTVTRISSSRCASSASTTMG